VGDAREDLDRLPAMGTGQVSEVLHPTQDRDPGLAKQVQDLAGIQVGDILGADHDIYRGYSTGGDGKVDTTWALVWHLDAAGKVDRVVNLSGDQHQMDAFIWANFPLKPLPERLVG
jgi:hypothetical protein